MYSLSTNDHALNDFLNNGDATGDLSRALILAENFSADITLRDEAGFTKGWVRANGEYQLN